MLSSTVKARDFIFLNFQIKRRSPQRQQELIDLSELILQKICLQVYLQMLSCKRKLLWLMPTSKWKLLQLQLNPTKTTPFLLGYKHHLKITTNQIHNIYLVHYQHLYFHNAIFYHQSSNRTSNMRYFPNSIFQSKQFLEIHFLF